MNLGGRLRRRREKLGLNQEELARIAQIGKSTLQTYEQGQIPKGDNLASLAIALRCTMDWLLLGAGRGPGEGVSEPVGAGYAPQPDVVWVPKVKARLSGGTGSLEVDAETEESYAFRRDWLERRGSVDNMRLMEVTGESMEPVLMDGDMVLIDQGKTEVLPGRIYAVSVDGQLFVKYIDTAPGVHLLRSANKDFEPIAIDPHQVEAGLYDFRVVAKVIWYCGELK